MTDGERPRGALSPADREYLRGNKELSEGAEFNTKRRIRERLRHALLDFGVVFHQLESSEAEKIFSDNNSDDMYMIINELHNILAFIFLAFLSSTNSHPRIENEMFTSIVTKGMRRALNKEGVIAEDIIVDIHAEYETFPSETNNIDLSDWSADALKQMLFIDKITPEQFADAIQQKRLEEVQGENLDQFSRATELEDDEKTPQ